ncbi:transposase [Streptomyces griseorubiginosus]|nr:transposase [Streptomyces griseorubiginosus]
MAAGHSIDPVRWREAFEVAMGRIAGRFARVEPRRRAGRLVLGLLADLPRKNCWTIAEWVGDANPHGMQHLLCRAAWDADAVRDDVREYVVEHLHDEAAVLVVDETGDVKKGTHTVGVQRQYTGTAGRIENSQVAVCLVYAGARGHAAVDRELYIPRSWISDPDRCRAAGLGEDTDFATKPELARVMIERFLDAGHHVGWVTGDEVYGGNPKLRSALEERGMGYVLAVACSAEVATRAGKFRADALAAKLPRRAWQKLSAGQGAKGQRYYDWAVIDLVATGSGGRQLLIRRNRATGELAYYRCHSAQLVPLNTLVRIAGSRWRVEEAFQTGKGLAGLDEHQVRRYPSWSRWVTLAMLAHAFLAVVRADEHAHRPGPDGLIPLTCNEIQRLFITVAVRPLHDLAHRLGWSDWRRRHQARSRNSHYLRQAASRT